MMRAKFWDAVRPLHSPLTKALRRRLGREYFRHPEMELPPAYEAVQLEVERRLHTYLHVAPGEVGQIVLVGANDGAEIPRLRQSYPACKVLCFEPSPQAFPVLSGNVRGMPFVEARELALSDFAGTATFHELSASGNGSLLPPNVEKWSEFCQASVTETAAFPVQVNTLDQETARLGRIDLLWMDVQGGEAKVLAGGRQALSRTAAVFAEVWMTRSPYAGGATFRELDAALAAADFTCVALGLHGWNFSGNALWLRGVNEKLCRPVQ